MYKILEQSIRAKSPDPQTCEDGLFISPDFIAVIDGVTSKGMLRWDGKTGGRHAKDVLSCAMENLDAEITAQEAIEGLNQALAAAAWDNVGIQERMPEECPQAVVIIYSQYRREVWSFGDCQCRIDGKVYAHNKSIDTILTEVRCMYNHMELLKGKTVEELRQLDAGRAFILPVLKDQTIFANTEGSYGYEVLNGFAIHPERVVIHPVKSGATVILASDGYPQVLETLADSEAALQKVMEQDPLCIEIYKGTKGLAPGNCSFDDRTYVRFIAE